MNDNTLNNNITLAPNNRLLLADEIKMEVLRLTDRERSTLLDAWKFLFVKHID